MKCPLDQQVLRRREIDPGLAAFECALCDGHWVRFGDYLGWRDAHPEDRPEVLAEDTPTDGRTDPPPEPGSLPRRCPDCDYLLTRFPVGHGVPFPLDRCGNCNGVWLDKGEWQALKRRGLHDNIHQMFSTAGQRAVRTDAQRRLTEAQFQRQLGAEDFAKAREFGKWLAGNRRPAEVLAYLQWLVR